MSTQPTPVVSVRNLKQYFKSGIGRNKLVIKAVDDISFDIFKGEVFGLVGESGCGKTTTGRTIIKLYQPTDGEVYFLGQRISAGIEGNKERIRSIRRETRNKIRELREQYKAASVDAVEEKKTALEKEFKTAVQELQDKKREVIRAEKKDIRKRLQTVEPDYELMKNMQMIFQDPIASLNPRMTVKEIVAEGLRIAGNRGRNQRIKKAKQVANEQIQELKQNVTDPQKLNEEISKIKEELKEFINKEKEPISIDEKVNKVLEKVGLLPEHASRYPHEFSGGQRQRIGIARALIVAPEFIIADEPISALDVSIQAQVINLLNDLREDLGITIMFIAHDLSVIKYFSDRIGVMYYGNLVELADAEELFKNPLHPYTRSLLSAVPLPDPRYEKNRKRIRYNPMKEHDYSKQEPTLQEIKKGHFVLANDEEIKRYKEMMV